MAGFTSPSILFLSTWDGPERTHCARILKGLRAKGYSRYVEPSVGGFAMPLVAVDNGWTAEQMDTTDVSLFTSTLGYMNAGHDLRNLGVRLDGDVVSLPGSPAEQAAQILWLQLLTRTEVRPEGEYWKQMVRDLRERKDEHLAALREQVEQMRSRLHGLTYRSKSLWEHLDEVADDPTAVIISNPPTYKGAYEKFFDTKGRLTWDAPEYPVFDAPVDIPKMVEMMEGRAALLVVQQQQEPGNAAHPNPPYARHLSPGQNVYLNSNRPEEIREIQGGLVVKRRNAARLDAMPLPPLPTDHEITKSSKVTMYQVPGSVADRYRSLWMHRLAAQQGGTSVMFAIDGYAAGIIGFNVASMSFSYSDKWSRHAILRFAFGAKHDDLRLTRLATMLALQKSTLEITETPPSAIFVAASQGLVTVEMTRHPEAKGLRGLMKLDNRQKHPDGYKLVYAADWAKPASPTEVLTEFLAKEKQWQASRR